MNPNLPETKRFLEVVKKLREMCPWDKEQTHSSLKPFVLEEAAEVADSIDEVEQNPEALLEELGDLLFQVAIHCEIASERHPENNFEKIAKGISDKMISRHPHVFGDLDLKTFEEVKANWKKLKEKEKPGRKHFSEVPKSLGALSQAQKIGKKASELGFDWEDASQVLKKVEEEWDEFHHAPDSEKEEEWGDILFAMSQLGRHFKIDSETALRKSSQKFIKRFESMEKNLNEEGKILKSLSEKEKDLEWRKVKRDE